MLRPSFSQRGSALRLAAILLVVLATTFAAATMAAPPAHADGTAARASAQVVEIHPNARAGLGRDTIVRLRLAYESPRDVVLSATLIDAAGAAIGINGGGALRPAGRGEAALWVGTRTALVARGIEVHIAALDSREAPVRLRMPLSISFTDAPGGSAAAPPGWFVALEAQQREARAAHALRNPPPPRGLLDELLAEAMIAALPLYPIAQIAMLVWLRGRWRLAAALPLLATGPLLAIVLWAGFVEANVGLLPIVAIFLFAPALAYLGLVALLRLGLSVAWR